MMKQICAFAVVAVMGLATAACSSNDKRYAAWGGGGAAAGALAGQAIGGSTKATLIGAAVGGAAGSAVAYQKNKDHKNKNKCTFRDSEGHTYTAPCNK